MTQPLTITITSRSILSPTEKKQLKTNMVNTVYMKFDVFSKNQDRAAPGVWLAQLPQNLIDNGVNPNHAVRFLRDSHLGIKTANSMAELNGSHSTGHVGSVRSCCPSPQPMEATHGLLATLLKKRTCESNYIWEYSL